MEETFTREVEIAIQEMLESINSQYHYDFRQYAPRSMNRTIAQAMIRMGCPTVALLRNKVLSNTEYFQDLIQSLTVPVSEMFRDPSYFLSLRERVIPHLRTYPSLKVWVAGCSTGEEVYSLAILLQEEGLLERTTLYATDINTRTVAAGEKGVFILDDMAKAARNHEEAGGRKPLASYYEISGNSAAFPRELKKHMFFTDHSLVTDSVFSEIHLISCRNVLIYFNRELQNRVFGLFYESLCRKGFLGLGSKETIHFSQYAKYFEPFVKNDRIFQKQ